MPILHWANPTYLAQNAAVDIRERIQSIIDANDEMTVRSVSLAAGFSDSMVHKFLTGQTQSMTLDNVNKLAAALGVNPRWLAYGDGPRVLPDNVAYIYDHIPLERRAQALKVLETFADETLAN